MAHPFPLKVVALQAGVSLATVERVVQGRRGRARLHRAPRAAGAGGTGQAERAGGLVRQEIHDRCADGGAAALYRLGAPGAGGGAARRCTRPCCARVFTCMKRWRWSASSSCWNASARMAATACCSRRPTCRRCSAPSPGWPRPAFPVVTLVTDLPGSRRSTYVGMDNRAAGETAAYLIGQWLGSAKKQQVLVTLSSNRYHGEEERELGFRRALRERHRHLSIVEVSEGHGIDGATGPLVAPGAAGAPRHCRRVFDWRRQCGHRRSVRAGGPALPGIYRPRPRRGQPGAAARRRHPGRAAP